MIAKVYQNCNKINKEKLLYVDDIRQVPNSFNDYYNVTKVTNYVDAIQELQKSCFEYIDLDHDLGEEKTGYDICKYIIENNIQCKTLYIHTSNPVGRYNMEQLIKRYTNFNVIIY